MKVIHLIDSLAGSGGAEQGLVRELIRFSEDLDQSVVYLYPRDALVPTLAASGITSHGFEIASTKAQSSYPTGIRRFLEIVRAERPDLIHTSLFTANTIGQVVGRLTKTPILSTFTLSGDPALLRAHQPNAGTRRAGVLRSLAGYAARAKNVYFRSLTEDAAITNAKLLGVSVDKVTVVPRGVPTDLRPDPVLDRRELGLPEDCRLLVNVGREVAQKGQAHLLRVFAQLRADHPDLHLAICGRTGEPSDDLTRLIDELELDDHVSRLGYTPHVHHVLAHASLFVFPSLMEGLGTALLEAMSVGVPIVAFDIPPVREAVGEDGATLVRVGDEEGLRKACHLYLSDESVRTAQIEAGRSRVSREYSIDAIAARVEALMRSIIERSAN